MGILKFFSGISLKRQKREMEEFIIILHGYDKDELYDVLISAINVYNHLRLTSEINLFKPFIVVRINPTAAFDFAKQAIALERNGLWLDAMGMRVWMHTLRAARHPENRGLGKNLWKELSRAMPSDKQYFPDGFDPFA